MPTISEAFAAAIELHQAGRLQAAEQIFRQILAVEPNDAAAWHLLGLIALQVGKHGAAVEHIGRAIALNPNVAPFHYNLGNAFKGQRKSAEAVACYRRALELNPDDAAAYNNLGNTLKDQGKLDEAVACYRRALELMPNFAEAHNNLGVAFKGRGELIKAIACYRQAVAQKADYAEAHNNLGTALEEEGELRGAEECYRDALRHNPRFALAHYKLARLLGAKLSDQDLALQLRLLEESALPDAQRLLLHFGVAQVLDGRSEYVEAARHLEEGNALQRAQWRNQGREYDPKEYASLVTKIIEVCCPEFFERVRGFGLESEVPVFVVGLPRSGTTIIEQILASHSQIFGAGEIKLVGETMAALGGQSADFFASLGQLNRDTTQQLASRHLEQLCSLDRAALRIVDKMPENYLFLGLLAILFPRAKFIHCRRDLRDVAVSCWMTHFQEARWTNDRQHIASRFHEYGRMMEHWRKVLPAPLLEVDYEETVADLEGVARKLITWCDVAWEPACLEFHRAKRAVRTASAVQVRQPVFSTSVGRWKRYEQPLRSLFAELEAATPHKTG
jgi:tetratricopeptide (TPR) repeat protein